MDSKEEKLFETSNSSVLLSIDGSRGKLSFHGAMNEDMDLKWVGSELASKRSKLSHLGVDVSGVQLMNSVGVREWLLLIEKLQADFELAFMKLNEIFIEQANFIPSVLGYADNAIGELELVYACPSCDNRQSLYVAAESLIRDRDAGSFNTPKQECSRCQEVMEFDAVESDYFAFLLPNVKRQARPK